ncbi:MAG: AlpA family phage regulatory protein, partial [Gammaproteobacteria bacterium]|nr:AlpA family phage regulatory protein [Gammaproteobacteria bacterium]
MTQLNILRFSQVQKKTGLCRSSIKNYARDGTFPAPIKLGNRAVGFIES